MRKKKLRLIEIEQDSSILKIGQKDLLELLGGSYQQASWDCVIRVLDFIDGPSYNYGTYTSNLASELGYDPVTMGGIQPSDFSKVGAKGSLNVVSVSSSSLDSLGRVNGNQTMLTFTEAGTNLSHAVAIIEVVTDPFRGKYYKVWDPTLGKEREISTGRVQGIYEVGSL